MTAAFVQSAAAASNSASFGSNTTIGNCLVACVQGYGATSISAVTIGSSHDHWTQLQAVPGGGQVIAVWINPACTVSKSSVTFTASGATILNCYAFEFSGLGNAPTLAVTPATSLVTTVPNSTSWSTGSTASAAAGTVQIGMLAGNTATALGVNGEGSPWHGPLTGMVQRVSGTYAGMVADYLIPGSPGAVTYTAGAANNQALHAGIALAISPGSTGAGSSSGSAFLPFFR